MAASGGSAYRPSVELRFGGERVVLRRSRAPSQSDDQLAQQVLQLVSRSLQKATARSRKSAPAHQIALLALMDLAREYLEAKRRTERFKQEVDQKAAQLQSLMDLVDKEEACPKET